LYTSESGAGIGVAGGHQNRGCIGRQIIGEVRLRRLQHGARRGRQQQRDKEREPQPKADLLHKRRLWLLRW
jgi:hypothetical protein